MVAAFSLFAVNFAFSAWYLRDKTGDKKTGSATFK